MVPDKQPAVKNSQVHFQVSKRHKHHPNFNRVFAEVFHRCFGTYIRDLWALWDILNWNTSPHFTWVWPSKSQMCNWKFQMWSFVTHDVARRTESSSRPDDALWSNLSDGFSKFVVWINSPVYSWVFSSKIDAKIDRMSSFCLSSVVYSYTHSSGGVYKMASGSRILWLLHPDFRLYRPQ